jgi:hypothetical protein
LTNAVNWPSPVPKVNDLVEIRTGLNANSGFRRITAVGASTITVASPFPAQDSGFTFTVTVSNSLVTGTGTHSSVTSFLDAGGNFVVNGVKPGHTLVITSGVNSGQRRQIVAVTATTLTTTAFSGTGFAVSYRVDNALGTFGGSNSLLVDLEALLTSEIDVLTSYSPPKPWAQVDAIEKFLDHLFTDLVVSATGAVGSSTAFSDASADFTTAGVNASHYVYIRTGANAGIYKVATVNSATSITIAGTFPSPPATGISYRIVRADFVGSKTLTDAFSVLQQTEATVTGVQAFLSLITTAVTVVGDAGAFARRTLTADLDARVTQINTRISYLTNTTTGGPVLLSNIMSSGDRLYDKRFVWIDARVNLEKGILPLKDRAIQDRAKAKKDTLKQLTKILSTKP